MTLLIEPFTLGPIGNNTYLIIDPVTHSAALIDPSFEIKTVMKRVRHAGYNLEQIWLTHAHFDHIAGVEDVLAATAPQPVNVVGLHPLDLPLWRSGGGASNFGFRFKMTAMPTLLFAHGQILTLGSETLEVLHTPGHTPGHVVFYSAESGVVLCGDLIFEGSVGRTDLPGGNHSQLLDSIEKCILPLPPQTRLLAGHGDETTVGREKQFNPFLR